MKIAGIIAEYDPFHNGHAYQIAKTKAAGADGVVVALGGEFTQRGEPAWCSKELRTKAALSCGADLVLEIPQPFAVGTAERFAKGGVSVLDSLGCVSVLSFGSECGDAETIRRFSEFLSTDDFFEAVRTELETGVSMPVAREKAVSALAPEFLPLMKNPNDRLAAEYAKALRQRNSAMELLAVRRFGAGHNEEVALRSGIASASYLRGFTNPEEIFPYVPKATHDLLFRAWQKRKIPADERRYEILALALLRTLPEEAFRNAPGGMEEGFYHRVYDAAKKARSLTELYELIKTKRYPMTRVRRTVAGVLLGLDETVLKNAEVPYLHVLGMNETGAAILREAKNTATLPISASLSELSAVPGGKVFADWESRAEDLWQLLVSCPESAGTAYTRKLVTTGKL